VSIGAATSTTIAEAVPLPTNPSQPAQSVDLSTMPPMLLTTTAAGGVLGVSKATVERMIGRGILPHLRLRDLVRVPADELERWMACVQDGC
jgi:excisionase family DNA binding protein